MHKVAVILSGCGYLDGSEVHESVSALLALDQLKVEAQCFAPDIPQHHVVNHVTGEEQAITRQVIEEAARIARGKVRPLTEIQVAEYSGLVFVGGFGAAKNLSTWAFDGPDCKVNEAVVQTVQAFYRERKVITAICVSPVILAKVLGSEGITITLGHEEEPANHEVAPFHQAVASLGCFAKNCGVRDHVVDEKHRLITTPAYMMEATIADIYHGVYGAIEKMAGMMS